MAAQRQHTLEVNAAQVETLYQWSAFKAWQAAGLEDTAQ